MNKIFRYCVFLVITTFSLLSFPMSYNLEFFPAVTVESFVDLAPDLLMVHDGTVIVLFDLDGTLICKPAGKTTYKLLEQATAELIFWLWKEGVVIMGLTSRKPRNAEQTKAALWAIEIDFAKLSRLGTKTYKISEDESLIDGIFYTSNRNKKVNFIEFLTETVERSLSLNGPFNVHFFDNNSDEIKAFVKYKKNILSGTGKLVRVMPYYYISPKMRRENKQHNWVGF